MHLIPGDQNPCCIIYGIFGNFFFPTQGPSWKANRSFQRGLQLPRVPQHVPHAPWGASTLRTSSAGTKGLRAVLCHPQSDDEKVDFRAFHQTIIYMNLIRMATERAALGMPVIVPLTLEEMEKPLGPGFNAGWYQFTTLGHRWGYATVKGNSNRERYSDNFD